jgi:hypothetical protein
MTGSLQLLLEESGVEWSAEQNHMPCMAHVIQLALGAFMNALGVKGREKSWEDTEREKMTADSGRVVKKKIGGARVERVALLKGGFNKIVEKVGLIF